ncbi:MAG TPA: hypothetical protein VFB54_19095 [Burkholderiales bacterium]|nr:hypothetical protein [Burkholderiales bacterium]
MGAHDADLDAFQARAEKALSKLDALARRVPYTRWLADDFVVLTMGSNPNPENSVLNLSNQSPVVRANPNRPNLTETFEV